MSARLHSAGILEQNTYICPINRLEPLIAYHLFSEREHPEMEFSKEANVSRKSESV